MQLSSYTGKKPPCEAFLPLLNFLQHPLSHGIRQYTLFLKFWEDVAEKYKLRHMFFSLLTLGSQQCSDLSLLISATAWPLFLITISPVIDTRSSRYQTLGSQQCSDFSLLISAAAWPLFLIAISPVNEVFLAICFKLVVYGWGF